MPLNALLIADLSALAMVLMESEGSFLNILAVLLCGVGFCTGSRLLGCGSNPGMTHLDSHPTGVVFVASTL